MNPIRKLLIAAIRNHLEHTQHYPYMMLGLNFVECSMCKQSVRVVGGNLYLYDKDNKPTKIEPEGF